MTVRILQSSSRAIRSMRGRERLVGLLAVANPDGRSGTGRCRPPARPRPARGARRSGGGPQSHERLAEGTVHHRHRGSTADAPSLSAGPDICLSTHRRRPLPCPAVPTGRPWLRILTWRLHGVCRVATLCISRPCRLGSGGIHPHQEPSVAIRRTNSAALSEGDGRMAMTRPWPGHTVRANRRLGASQ